MTLSRMTIGSKLTLGIGAQIAFVLALSYAALSGLGSLNQAVKRAYGKGAEDVRKVYLAGQIDADASVLLGAEKAILLRANSKNSELLAQNQRSFDAARAGVEKSAAEMQPLLTNEEAKRMLAAIQSALAAWESLHREMAHSVESRHAKVALKLLDDRIERWAGR
jgi:hypothetical protein